MKIHTDVKIEMNEEEMKRWTDAYDTIFKIYHALPKGCEAEKMLDEIIGWIEDFDAMYIED